MSVHEKTIDGLTVTVEYCTDSQSPRKEYEHLATLSFKDGTGDGNVAMPDERIWAFPVYKYEHSAVAYSLTPFSCPWDSCQIGWAWVNANDVESEEEAREVIVCELEEYTSWANGEVYEYYITDENGNRIDSCWDLIGEEYAIEAANEALEANLNQMAACSSHVAI